MMVGSMSLGAGFAPGFVEVVGGSWNMGMLPRWK